MRAEEALAQSEDDLIVADTSRGLVTIYCESEKATELADAFHVRVVPRDRDGRLNGVGTVEVGSYDDLDIAVTIAALSYGVCDTSWTPTSARRLKSAVSKGHAPDIEGRRISFHVEHRRGDPGEER